MNSVEQLLLERELPSLLDGVSTAEEFTDRQEKIGRTLMERQFGVIPPKPDHMYVEVTSTDENFAAGKVVLKNLKFTFEYDNKTFSFPCVSAIPKSEKKLPAFVHINFFDFVHGKYMPLEEICDGGFAVFSFCYKDVTSDDGDFKNGCAKYLVKSRQKKTAPGKIAIWAWAAMRMMDYIETLPEIDPENVAVIGHSRLGKTALLAGAFDKRFKYVISNDSGCCGAAIERGKIGERYQRIAEVFPYWFCPSFVKDATFGVEMPYDQHFLLAMSVPRHVIVGSAEEDLWADPTSEFLSLAAINEAYALFGLPGLVHDGKVPSPDRVLGNGSSAYHIRRGTHYFSRRDWNAYMDIIKSWMNDN